MKFGTVPVEEAPGGLLARSVRLPGFFISKGQMIGPEDVARLRSAGVTFLTVARLEKHDIAEDFAAARIGRLLAGAGIVAREARAGRCELCAAFPGLLDFVPSAISTLNHIHDGVALATLPLHEIVEPGAIVATVKAHPFAVPEIVVAAWERAAAARPLLSLGAHKAKGLLRVAPFRPFRASLIQTVAPGLKESVLAKTSRSTRERLEAYGAALCADLRAPHEEQALAQELRQRRAEGDDLILICGAYSTADRRDVVPSAVEIAGGEVRHFGMPVDPGNLMLLGAMGDAPVIGMPGCARTTEPNGFDRLLRLLLAGLPVGRAQIMSMGVGGLLRDKPRRRRASNGKPPAPRIAAVVLAAGQSSRMGANKLAATLDGKPVLRHVVDNIRAARLDKIVVVLGHQADETRALLAGAGVDTVVNEHYRKGIATSLQAGIAALPDEIDGAMIFLGDMPDIDAALIGRLTEAFDPARMRAIVVPKREGRQGNPVLWGRAFFPILAEETHGDSGAKHLIPRYARWVAEIPADTDAIFADLDTAEALRQRRERGSREAKNLPLDPSPLQT